MQARFDAEVPSTIFLFLGITFTFDFLHFRFDAIYNGNDNGNPFSSVEVSAFGKQMLKMFSPEGRRHFEAQNK